MWSAHKQLGLTRYIAENVLGIVLVVTVMMRSLLTIFPDRNPLPLDNQRCLDVLVLVICIFLPTQCFLSAAGVAHFLKPRRILNAIFRSACPHFRKKVCNIMDLRVNARTIVVLLLMLLSLAYAFHHGCIVYEQWAYRVPFYIQVLELIPAFALGMQSVGQGFVLLFTSLCPVASKSLHKMNQDMFIKEIYFHLVLNLALLVNPVTMTLIVLVKEHSTMTLVFLGLAVSELAYQLYSVYCFHKIALENALLKHVQDVSGLLLVHDREYSISKLLSVLQSKKSARTLSSPGDALAAAQSDIPMNLFLHTEGHKSENSNCNKEHKLLCHSAEYDFEVLKQYPKCTKPKMD